MLGVRVNSISESGLGEPEQDANSALTELDKGLRSEKIGEQCEAIVRFPRLFEKYPFPILINSSLLKLADLFRTGNNFLRLWILRVCQQSEKHLDKIINVDEFVRRIFSVIHSNDPIARALTLRTLGSVAGIIPERQQVHHSIRRSLDSHDVVEVEATIYAAMQFAAQSKTFAVSMCNKVSDMIQGLATPANMKLQLIPILQHMHHDTSTATMVRKLCTELLPSYPAQEFVLVTLNTLTQLASATLVDIPSQVSLLLEYLRTDPRWAVKAQALRNLHSLAGQGAHLWPEGALEDIVGVALELDPPNQQVLSSALDVLLVLANSGASCLTQLNHGSSLIQLCNLSSYSSSPSIAGKAVQVMTRIVCNSSDEEQQVLPVSDVVDKVESLLLLVTSNKFGKYTHELKVCLHCAVSLCKVHANVCPSVVDLLGLALMETDSCPLMTLLCEALGAIGDLREGALLQLIPDILDKLGQLNKDEARMPEESHTKVMLCTLVFQTMIGYEWDPDTKKFIEEIILNTNLWASYRIARSAARYTHHSVAASTLKLTHERVSSEHLYFWLVALHELSLGEAALMNQVSYPSLVDRLNLATAQYSKALAALKAASTPGSSLQFQAEYTRLRAEFLQCLAQLVHTCHSLCTSPPPAVASAIPENNLQRYGHITNQLRKCVKEFRLCGEMYWRLYQSAFDADPASLANIQILQQMCVLMAHTVERVAQASYQDEAALDFSCQHAGLETKYLIRCCQEACTIGQQLVWTEDQKTITHQHIECLLRQVQTLADSSLCLPRYFFQVLQSTNITLMVSPKPRVLGESISVSSNSQLAVKVEGVIQHGKRPGLFRKVSGVTVTVLSQLQKQQTHDLKGRESDSVLTATVTPHRDFFTAQFLLEFPVGGQYVVGVEAAVEDEQCNLWRTGPRSSLAVKCIEEAKSGGAPGSTSRAGYSTPRY